MITATALQQRYFLFHKVMGLFASGVVLNVARQPESWKPDTGNVPAVGTSTSGGCPHRGRVV